VADKSNIARTPEDGALTSADVIATFGIEMRLRRQAHGGEVTPSIKCAACGEMAEALAHWLNAHMLGPEELPGMPSGDPALDGCKEMPR